MKVLVTGGAGFIGSHIVQELLLNHHEVVVLDNLSTGLLANVPKGIRVVVQDIVSSLDQLFREECFDAVIHQAAQVSVPLSIKEPFYDLRVNIMGLLCLLEACQKYRVRKVIFASSAAVYGQPIYLPITEEHPLIPLSHYGVSKKNAEEYIRVYQKLYDIQFTILRYANVYGPCQSVKGESGVVAIFSDALCCGRIPVIFGDGEDTRDYVYVQDVARANVLALERGHRQILNIATETPVSVNQLYFMICATYGEDKLPSFAPARIGDIKHSQLSAEKAKKVLDWEPRVSLKEGLKKTVEWNRFAQTSFYQESGFF